MWGEHKRVRVRLGWYDEDNHWAKHPEVLRWRQRQKYNKNPRKYIGAAQRYNKDNLEYKREYGRQHYRKNPEIYAERARARKKRVSTLNGDLTLRERRLIREIYRLRNILNRQNPARPFEVDHVIPLAAGGEHEPNNLSIATKGYNSWKRDNIIQCPSDYFTPGGRK